MDFKVNGSNNVFGVGNLKATGEVAKNEFLNTIFGNKNPRGVSHTGFSKEEQHVLGILANHQNIVLIED